MKRVIRAFLHWEESSRIKRLCYGSYTVHRNIVNEASHLDNFFLVLVIPYPIWLPIFYCVNKFRIEVITFHFKSNTSIHNGLTCSTEHCNGARVSRLACKTGESSLSRVTLHAFYLDGIYVALVSRVHTCQRVSGLARITPHLDRP